MDRRKTRIRSDLREGDLVTKRKGWFIPVENKPWATIWGVLGRNGEIEIVPPSPIFLPDGTGELAANDDLDVGPFLMFYFGSAIVLGILIATVLLLK